jgi:2'-5' RNA ligase
MAEDPTEPVDSAQRLFLGIEVPRAARAVVVSAIASWRDRFPDARWVPSENWHVTVKFLGWTPAHLVSWVGTTVEAIAALHPPLETAVHGLGAFPSPRRARVLWAGIVDPAGSLSVLARALDSGLEAEYRLESRPFHPHLTVARCDPPLPLPESYAEATLASEGFVAERLIVFRSHLGGPSTRYEPIRTFPLRG